jgi:hypothetical protein
MVNTASLSVVAPNDDVSSRIGRWAVHEWAWIAVVIAALAAPVVWITLSRHYVNASDWATIELRTRDVFSAHPPLFGAWSRYGWAHPGPMAFYLYAVPYRLLGYDAQALQIAALLVNAVAIGSTMWLLRRRGQAAFLIGGLALVAMVWGLYPSALGDSWNATNVIIPSFLTVIACWSCLCGDKLAPLVATAAFLFVIEGHVGFGLVFGPLYVLTIVYVLVHPQLRTALRRSLRYAAVLAALVLVPTVVDVAMNWPSNLARFVRWSTTNDLPPAGPSSAVRVFGRASSLSFLAEPRLPNFLATLANPMPMGFLPGMLLALLVGALGISVARKFRAEALLSGSLLLSWIAAFAATANVRGPEYEWLYGYLQPLGWLSWAAVFLVAVRWVRHSSERFSRQVYTTAGIIAALVALIVLLLDHGQRTVAGNYVFADLVEPIEQFAASAETAADETAPNLVTFAGDPNVAGGVHAGLVNQLDRRGYEVAIEHGLSELQFGKHRLVNERSETQFLVRAESETTDPPPGATILSVWDELSPAERAEVDRLTAELTDVLQSVGLADRAGLLATPTAYWLLIDDPPSAVAERATDIERLSRLREEGGLRLVLYLLRPIDHE